MKQNFLENYSRPHIIDGENEISTNIHTAKTMTSENMNIAMYDALKSAGAPEDQARAAARTVPLQSELVTKSDLKAALAELEMRLTWRIVLALGFFSALVTFLDKI